MSLDIRIDTSELDGLVRRLKGLNERGLSFATERATNNVAFKVREAWKTKAGQVFDRPTPFTRNSVLVRKANRANPVARVFLRDEAGDGVSPQLYLQQQVTSGQRRQKRSERALQAGGYMPAGHFIVPGQGAKLDAYGNVRAGQINRILSALRVNNDPGQNQTGSSKAKAKRRGAATLFAVTTRRGRLLPGVYERKGNDLKPVLIFVRSARYTARFPIFDFARAVLQREAVPEMRKQVVSEIERALARK